MNRSRREMRRVGMVADSGAPFCRGCNRRLQFSTDRNGRTMESCACGYSAYLATRSGLVALRETPAHG